MLVVVVSEIFKLFSITMNQGFVLFSGSSSSYFINGKLFLRAGWVFVAGFLRRLFLTLWSLLSSASAYASHSTYCTYNQQIFSVQPSAPSKQALTFTIRPSHFLFSLPYFYLFFKKDLFSHFRQFLFHFFLFWFFFFYVLFKCSIFRVPVLITSKCTIHKNSLVHLLCK
jgi:hypothetical protein